ncbi:MAG: septal ring lytic transglycosylase RlpA family protein [Rickettsiaceae bacterium]|nr:septal ring lytic transglycosylase RlpA family protein [Rickettsiaceae bacterium]
MASLSLVLSGCSSNQSLYRKLSKDDRGNNRYKGHYKIGNEYRVNGKTYKPAKDTKYDQVGMGSWYGSKDGFHGKKTANGDLYNKKMLTAAHRTLPMPSIVKVTNLENNKSLMVMVNDRGPFRKDRIIDVSESAAQTLGFKQKGVAKLRVQYMKDETKDFLHNIKLSSSPGAKTKKKVQNSRCSVNCHIKLINMKHRLL